MARDVATIGHFDIAGDDLDVLARFYGGVLGWKVTPRGPGYAEIETPGLPGAMVEAPEASLTIGVVVDDLAAVLAQAATMGGEVVMPATDNGWVTKGKVRDPFGNVLTLIQK